VVVWAWEGLPLLDKDGIGPGNEDESEYFRPQVTEMENLARSSSYSSNTMLTKSS
jgi:hypothetical protein